MPRPLPQVSDPAPAPPSPATETSRAAQWGRLRQSAEQTEEARGRAIVAADGWVDSIRAYIRDQTGYLPYVQAVHPAECLSVDDTTRRLCTVRLLDAGGATVRAVQYDPAPPTPGAFPYAARRTVRLNPASPRGAPELVHWTLKVAGRLWLYNVGGLLSRYPWPPVSGDPPGSGDVQVLQATLDSFAGSESRGLDGNGRYWVRNVTGGHQYEAYGAYGAGAVEATLPFYAGADPIFGWIAADPSGPALLNSYRSGPRLYGGLGEATSYHRLLADGAAGASVDIGPIVGGEQIGVVWSGATGALHWAVWNDADDGHSGIGDDPGQSAQATGFFSTDHGRVDIPGVVYGDHEEVWEYAPVIGVEGEVIKRAIVTKRIRDYSPSFPTVDAQRTQFWLVEDPETNPVLTLLSSYQEIAPGSVAVSIIESTVWNGVFRYASSSELGATHNWAASLDGVQIYATGFFANEGYDPPPPDFYSTDGGHTWAVSPISVTNPTIIRDAP